MQKYILNSRYQKITLISLAIAVPIIIYLYFLQWRTDVIYGDDLFIYTSFSKLTGLFEKINFSISSEKFRPMQGTAVTFLIETFQKNLSAYYLFNVAIQTCIAFSFALVVNIFFKSPVYSLLTGLVLALSRFSFFNITQLFNGGALEGLAQMLFLLSLFFILKALTNESEDNPIKQKNIILGLLFVNLTFYTHERYIVVFPFIILVVLFFPTLRTLPGKQKLFLVVGAVFSILLNVIIKKYIFSVPFFVGTGGTNISFSWSNVIQFLTEAVLSVMQINVGLAHIVGRPFSTLPVFDQILVYLFCLTFLAITVFYLISVWRNKLSDSTHNLALIISLITLLGFLLAPAVVTIRLEQRWLQAPLSIFILVVVIMVQVLKFKTSYIPALLFSCFIVLFIWTDYNYLSKGSKYIYLTDAERVARIFKRAVDNGAISERTNNLYIWQKQKDTNAESAVKWYLIEGEFFSFYQNKAKKIIFINSADEKFNIDANTDQIIYIGNNGIINLTNFYLQDSIPPNLKQ